MSHDSTDQRPVPDTTRNEIMPRDDDRELEFQLTEESWERIRTLADKVF